MQSRPLSASPEFAAFRLSYLISHYTQGGGTGSNLVGNYS